MSTTDSGVETIGFIGLGVMGEPICRNIAQKRGAGERLLGYDLSAEPLARLAGYGVSAAASVTALADEAELIFLSLPGGPEVENVVRRDGGLLDRAGAHTTVLDLGTTPVALTRELAARFGERGAAFIDAPVARTRQAAERGALAVMVGGPADAFARVEPYLRRFASDVTRCGGHGAGQTVKILNNMVLFQTVAALAEALTVARCSDVDGATLFDALAAGSADSFALRSHGIKALLPGEFPRRAFSTRYAAKDLDYALALAADAGVALPGAENVRRLFDDAIAAGYGDDYWPVLLRLFASSEGEA